MDSGLLLAILVICEETETSVDDFIEALVGVAWDEELAGDLKDNVLH